jgi:hypothetical protein
LAFRSAFDAAPLALRRCLLSHDAAWSANIRFF